jgi:prepilin-type N-terminal cleavage/methylation domain-containing protein
MEHEAPIIATDAAFSIIGCDLRMSELNWNQMTRQKLRRLGFTMIELLIVIGIMGILLAIIVNKYGGLVVRAREAEVKASLAAIRSAISIYYSDNAGAYPDNISVGLVANQKYLTKLPTVTIPAVPGTSNKGHFEVTGEKLLSTPDDDVYTGIWMYNPGPANWGQVLVNCVHSDSKGIPWSNY